MVIIDVVVGDRWFHGASLALEPRRGEADCDVKELMDVRLLGNIKSDALL